MSFVTDSPAYSKLHYSLAKGRKQVLQKKLFISERIGQKCSQSNSKNEPVCRITEFTNPLELGTCKELFGEGTITGEGIALFILFLKINDKSSIKNMIGHYSLDRK